MNLVILFAIFLAFLIGVAFGVFIWKYRHNAKQLILKYGEMRRKSYHTISDDKTIMLQTRTFKAALAQDKINTERDSSYDYHQRRLKISEIAIIIIDAWAQHPNDGWLKRAQVNMRTKLKPLLGLARQNNMTIVHSPHGHDIAEIVKPIEGELIITGEEDAYRDVLTTYLKSRGINTLLYAGYSSNWCVINRQDGIIKMRELGYNIILFRDCTIAFETPDSLNGKWANKIIINTVEHQWGETTTLEDLQKAFDNI
jgi:nicotinamidase-related amidase